MLECAIAKEIQHQTCFVVLSRNARMIITSLHRMTNGWSGKGPLKVTWSNPLHKQGHLEPVAQDCVQSAFEYLQGWRLHNLPKQPVTLTVKTVVPDVQSQLPVFQFVPIASGPGTGHHWEEPHFFLFAPSLQVLLYIDNIPLSLLFSRLNSSSSLSLSS